MAELPNRLEQEMNIPRPVRVLLGLVLVLGGVFFVALALYPTEAFPGAPRLAIGGKVALIFFLVGLSALMLYLGYLLLRMKESTEYLWSRASMAKYGGWSFVVMGLAGIAFGIASFFVDFDSNGPQWQDIAGGLAISGFGYRWSQSRKIKQQSRSN